MKERIRHLLESEGITASQFAEKIGIQRSSVSHLLSGRNKPGFELITGILREFPEVNPDWLIMGRGEVYRSEQNIERVKISVEPDVEQIEEIDNQDEERQTDQEPPVKDDPRSIERIIVFYHDRTFREYKPG